MTAITILDLDNAKLDVDHIATVATSPALTATDRLGTTKSTLSAAIDSIKAFANRGAWTALTIYAGKDLVSNSGTWYVCVTAHTSSATFAADVSTYWRVYQGVTTGDLSATAGASLVGYLPNGTDAVATTVKNVLDLAPIHVKNFGALTNGTDATAAINKAILAAQKRKANQLSYDEVYSIEVNFDGGQDYTVLGPILLPSGVILNGNGCRLVGNYPSASTTAYSDAAPSIIETAYYDGATITTNRGATLNTKRIVGGGICNFTFVNANCGINATQFNERSFIRNVNFSNCSATMRFTNSYYGKIDDVRIAGSSTAANQYAISLYGGNHNAMTFNKVFFGASVSVCMAVSGPASSGVSITNSSFESSTGVGIQFAADAYCLGWNISSNYFEGIRYGIVALAGAGVYGVSINNNFFSSCEYAVLGATNSIRVGNFKGNAASDGGGVIRNLVDLGTTGNDVRYQIPSKTANTTTGPSAFGTNHIPSNASTVEATSTWTRISSPFDAIGKASPGLANQNKLNEFAFEGAQILTVANEVPFCSLVRAVNTLTVNTSITYDLSNVLVFNFYGATDAVNYDLKGFIFGTTVSWVTHLPIGVVLTVNNSGGYVQLVFTNLTAATPVINVSGTVRHV